MYLNLTPSLTQYQGGQLSSIRINNVICHSQYSPEANDNDIALIELIAPAFEVTLASSSLFLSLEQPTEQPTSAQAFGFGAVSGYFGVVQREKCVDQTVIPSSWVWQIANIDPFSRLFRSRDGASENHFLVGFPYHEPIGNSRSLKLVPKTREQRLVNVFGGMSGGGLFDRENHLIGIISHSRAFLELEWAGYWAFMKECYNPSRRDELWKTQFFDYYVSVAGYREWITRAISESELHP